MAIPLDSATGLLPPGEHPATVDEVRTDLVDAFPASRTRAQVFDNWTEHRKAIDELATLGNQWLDGSFTTAKVDPNDADVVTFLDHVEVEALPDHKKILLSGLFLGKATRSVCACDAYLVVEYPSGHPAYSAYLRAKGYWMGVFEKVRTDPRARKGVVLVAP